MIVVHHALPHWVAPRMLSLRCQQSVKFVMLCAKAACFSSFELWCSIAMAADHYHTPPPWLPLDCLRLDSQQSDAHIMFFAPFNHLCQFV